MTFDLELNTPILNTIVGGKSILDAPKLHIQSKDEAYAFIKSYGFDLHQESEVNRLWGYHRRALVFLTEKLLDEGEIVPEKISDPKNLGDIRELLLLASSSDPSVTELRRWACALLRVMHIFIHSEKDLFSYYSAEIQKQVLTPIQECIIHESGRTLLRHPFASDSIPLFNFEIKPFKTASSSAIKLLAKPDVVALKVLDKVGARFITESLFDAFRVAIYLAENNLINYAHVMPDQSTNTLYPFEMLMQVLKQSVSDGESQFNPEKMDAKLSEHLKLSAVNPNYLRKENSHSDSSYRFLKFICRKLITLPADAGREPLRFFYPFEIQIMDRKTYEMNESGAANHKEYKARQRLAARNRVFLQGGEG